MLRVDGRVVALRPAGPPVLTHPAGQGGLRTTRLELPLRAAVDAPRVVELRDGTFPGRVGWVAVQARPGAGTAVRTTAPATDPTGGLRRYPADLLASPSDERTARFAVAPGDGTLAAGGGRVSTGGGGGGDGFAGLLDGDGMLVLLLLAAFGWGALHALSPGHGKAMVAAYLVGTRGSTRDALLLGATVTVTHTAGVVALGVVALGLSAWILPEQLYPWLTLLSGALVVGVGVSVLRARLRGRGHGHTTTATARPTPTPTATARTSTRTRRDPRGAICPRWARRPGSSRARPRSSSSSAPSPSTGSGSGWSSSSRSPPGSRRRCPRSGSRSSTPGGCSPGSRCPGRWPARSRRSPPR